ncbi:MAG TPA: ABC transporter ATP-binding protein [Actinomycetota bacterium]|nr:ABC transporter ATP-binding protein [Actinomycetota bacterium]
MTSATADAPAIRTEGLTKSYGRKRGIIDVDLEVRRGEIFGYLGPNGAGKSTTIRLLLDLIRPTHGTASVFGHPAHGSAVKLRREIGYLPGEMALYPRMTGRELFRYFAALRGMRDLTHAEELAERLDTELDRPIKALSHGNKQKVGLVQALMHRPSLVILDEPTTGLDPLVQQEFYRILDEVRADGRTVFLSSHVLAEVERVADRVGIVREGRIAVVSEVEALKRQARRKLEFHFDEPVPVEDFVRLPGVVEAVPDGRVLQLTVEGSVDDIIKLASRYTVLNVLSREQDLEEVFLTYYAVPESEADAPADAHGGGGA